jgi:uncharacterized protein YuzE
MVEQTINKSNSDLTQGGLHMNKTTMTYFKNEDILHVAIYDEKEANSIELSPNITAEMNERGELIGIEILEAISFIRDSTLESSQAKILELKEAV